MHTRTDQDAYALAVSTDEEWMNAIRRAFPNKRAGDVRYTEQAHGEEGSALRAAYDRYVEARDAWDAIRTAYYARERRLREQHLRVVERRYG